jgi:RimJ/RimL family protein N-acetyltransferase
MNMPLAKAYRIETERLTIRCYDPGDGDKLHEAILHSLDHLRPWMPWACEEPKPHGSRVDLLRFFRGQFDLGLDYAFGIFNKTNSTLLGATGLHTRVGADAREIGYWISATHVNKGYATEAVSALIRISFGIEEMNHVEIRCSPQNVRSQHIPLKLGFQLETILKNETTDGQGKPRDTMVWSLSRKDFESQVVRYPPVRAFDILGQEIPQG